MNFFTLRRKTNVLFFLLLFFSTSSFAQRINEEMLEQIRKQHIPGDQHQFDKYIKKLEFDYSQKHPELLKNRNSNYKDYLSLTDDKKPSAEIVVSKTDLLKVLRSAKFNVEPSSSGMLSSLRTAAREDNAEIPYTKLLQSTIRQDYDVATEDFHNSQMTSYVYKDRYSTTTYDVLADENGDLLDTVKIEYREFNPLSEGQIIGQEIYEKINDSLILTLSFIEKAEGNELIDGETVKTDFYQYSYFASYQTNPESGDSYLNYERISEQKGDTTHRNSYIYYSSGSYSSKSEDISHRTLGTISSLNENYDYDGNTVDGNKQQSKFDNYGKLLERTFEIWDAQLSSYYINYQHANSYDENERLIREVMDFGQSKNKYDYEWDQDTIVSTIYAHQNLEDQVWTNTSKTSYYYKEDTTLTTTQEYNGTEWINERDLAWYVYFNDDEGNKYQVHSYGTLGQEPYSNLDTTMNFPANCQTFYRKEYQWDGLKYKITSIEQQNYDEQCHRILSIFALNGWGSKEESLYSENVNYSLYANSNDQDISNGIDWDIMNYTYYKIDRNKPEGLYREVISYWGGTYAGGWKFEEYADSNHNISNYSGYRLSMNAPPNEFVWWQELSQDYTYDENQNLIEVTTQKSFNEESPLALFSKKLYTNNEFGIETIVDGYWDGTIFTLTDSLFFSYDVNGYQTEEKRFYYQSDQITSGYKILYNYPEGDLDALCAITFIGDTLIKDGSTIINANMPGESSTYEWINAENEILENSSQIEITDEGTYFVSAINGLCSNTDSIRIWNSCELTVKGDTVIRRKRARLQAFMEGAETNYKWMNISNKLQSRYQNVEINNEGIYYVIATNNESGCANTDTVTIWKFRPIFVFGDSLLRRGRALIEAYLEGNFEADFSWYNEGGAIIGKLSTLRTSDPGVYKVVAKSNFRYGEAVWRISETDNSMLKNNYQVYPNPTSDYLQVQLADPNDENIQLSLIDLNGKIISQKDFTIGRKNTELNLLGSKPGIYILKIESENSETYRKIVVE